MVKEAYTEMQGQRKPCLGKSWVAWPCGEADLCCRAADGSYVQVITGEVRQIQRAGEKQRGR